MPRSTARTAAMQMIFEKLSGGQSGEETLQLVYEQLRADGVPGVERVHQSEPGDGDRAYIVKLFEGVLAQVEELDVVIAAAARGWAIDRMPMVDLTVLRLAAWEILHEEDVPGNVVIAEALEMVNRYSDPDNKTFVNGVLGTILRQHEGKQ